MGTPERRWSAHVPATSSVERDRRDEPDEVEIQSVHVAPFSQVSRVTRHGAWRWRTFQHPARRLARPPRNDTACVVVLAANRLNLSPTYPLKVMPLTSRKFLRIASSNPALLYHLWPQAVQPVAHHMSMKLSLAQVLATKAAQPRSVPGSLRPMQSPAAEFLPPPLRPSASISQLTVLLLLRFIMISDTHPKK